MEDKMADLVVDQYEMLDWLDFVIRITIHDRESDKYRTVLVSNVADFKANSIRLASIRYSYSSVIGRPMDRYSALGVLMCFQEGDSEGMSEFFADERQYERREVMQVMEGLSSEEWIKYFGKLHGYWIKQLHIYRNHSRISRRDILDEFESKGGSLPRLFRLIMLLSDETFQKVVEMVPSQ